MYGINSFIDAVCKSNWNNRFENIYNERQIILSEIRKKWLLIHILDCQGQETYD